MTTRPGFALLVSMLIIAALGIAAAGMLALGAREATIASAMARRAAARHDAESAVRRALVGWSTRRYKDLDVGEVAAEEGPGSAVTVRRLGPSLFVVQARVDHGGVAHGASYGAAALVRTLEPDSIAPALAAAVIADEQVVVVGGTVAVEPSCLAEEAAGAMAPAVAVGPGATVGGDPAVLIGAPGPIPGEVLFTAPMVDRLATTIFEGLIATPWPRFGSDGCEQAPLNWGAVAPSHVCHDHRPLVRVGADVIVRGGQGRGLLVADGNALLDGVRFDGVILARGTVTVLAGTHVRGTIRARDIRIHGGRVEHDRCAVLDALTAGGLDGPFRSADRLWIPVF